MFPQFTQLTFAGHRGRLLGRARPRARRADAHVLRRRGCRTSSTTSASSRATTPRRSRAHARELAGEGYEVIYLKVGRGVERRRRLRRRRARGDRARAGCCGSTRTRPGTRRPRSTGSACSSSYDLDWVEQPTPAGDVNGLAHVRRSVSVKIAADQAVFTTSQLLHVLEKEAADVVVQGSHDAGGLLRFRQQAFVCDAFGLRVNRHAFMESEISFYANAQVAVDDPEPHARQPDHAPAPRRAAHARAAARRSPGGRYRPDDAPGHGFELDHDAVGVAHERWQRDGAYNTIEIRSKEATDELRSGRPDGLRRRRVRRRRARRALPIWDHGVLYGDGIFEGMRLFSGSLFRPYDHLARLADSARALGLELPLDGDELLDVICEVIVRSGLEDAHVRPIVTRGFGAPGLDPARCERRRSSSPPTRSRRCSAATRSASSISSIVRKAPRSVGAHVKSLNYIDAVLAKRQANAAGARRRRHARPPRRGRRVHRREPVRGRSAATLVTPTLRSALPGITRRTILEVAEEQGIPTEVRDLWPMELYTADAMFATGSGAGIVLDRPRRREPRSPPPATRSSRRSRTATGRARATRATWSRCRSGSAP